jgi:hypothetical protein
MTIRLPASIYVFEFAVEFSLSRVARASSRPENFAPELTRTREIVERLSRVT